MQIFNHLRYNRGQHSVYLNTGKLHFIYPGADITTTNKK
jgi:hypothetical protein